MPKLAVEEKEKYRKQYFEHMAFIETRMTLIEWVQQQSNCEDLLAILQRNNKKTFP